MTPTLQLVTPAAAGSPQLPISSEFAGLRDRDGNGIEDLLDDWRAGKSDWSSLRDQSLAARTRATATKSHVEAPWSTEAAAPPPGAWSAGKTRLLHFGGAAGKARDKARLAGACEVLHASHRFGGFQLVAVDAAGLAAYLDAEPGGTILLDRDGVPALHAARPLVGADHLNIPPWELGDDWSATVAILDSGCDTAHGDLGDHADDDRDGPAPAVGDPGDWYPADGGWPLFDGYKVVGWHDVTDDFPEAVGPWDYHHHGTALASVVAGTGRVDPAMTGVVPGARLTVVKFYDFDTTWHAWAGDFLAACDWVLEHRDTYRIGTVLAAVNWDVDAGLSAAMAELVDAGIVPVVAMGNQGASAPPGYPAALDDVLTCGGVNADGAVAAFSGWDQPGLGKPDLVAPSGGLLPTGGRIEVADNEPNDSYSGRYGTSLSAAFTAGAVYVLDEALRERGIVLGAGRDAARRRMLALTTTCAPVDFMEDPSGAGVMPLVAEAQDVAGAGLMRIDAAVASLTLPLLQGHDQSDTLSADWQRPVVARRLATQEGVRYLVEAVPDPGLDIVLEVVDPTGRLSGVDDVSVVRDQSGAGISEFAYVRPGAGHGLSLVVKRRAGEGAVVLRLRDADLFPVMAMTRELPGIVTASPNVAYLDATGEPSLVVPARVSVDDAARSLNVFDLAGNGRTGWPVFFFPHVSAQGGLRQPLVWDLDGVPGDELVVTSGYGTIYFLAADGSYTFQELAFNRSLTRAVGIIAGPNKRVVAVDKLGRVFLWGADGTLLGQVDLGHELPLAPAVGQLEVGGVEHLVISFADGHLTVLDAALATVPGWPVDLGVTLDKAPLLLDLDEDGDHEILVPVLDGGALTVRAFHGDGTPATGDGVRLDPPTGGSWLAISPPAVTGRYGTGELGLTCAGLATNDLSGDAAAWSFGTATLLGQGRTAGASYDAFAVEATTTQGLLQLDWALLPAPLCWNQRGGTGLEPTSLMHVVWSEALYGLTSIPGSACAWHRPAADGAPVWDPQGMAGPTPESIGMAVTAMMDPGEGALVRAHALDTTLQMVPVLAGDGGVVPWAVERGDGRNSGSYPLAAPLAAVGDEAPTPTSLTVYPNPGSGRFRFRLDTGTATGAISVDLYDLRGRRVHRLSGVGVEAVWDGRGDDGRPAAAGTYFAVVRTARGVHTSRFVLTH